MHPYLEYIDSGNKWIGMIPSHWKSMKLKHLVNLFGRIGWRGLTTDDYVDDGVILLGVRNITIDYKLDISNISRIPIGKYDESPEIKVQQDDILLAKTGATIGKCCVVEVINEPMTVNAAVNIFRSKKDVSSKYFMYLIASDVIQKEFFVSTSSNAQGNLFQHDIKEIYGLNPPLNEQSAIANFLDHKTHQIDDLIAKKERLIELLKEERTAMINQAVTKGLDPNVPMKDSGIEWLGEIPEHWTIRRLKFLVDNIIEKSNTSDFKIALENIESWTGRFLKSENSSELTGEMKSFKPNDVLFNKLRPYLAKVFLPKVEGECVGELLVLRSAAFINPKFLFYRLLSRDFIEVVNGSTYGAKMPRASWEDFIRNLLIPYPEINEQKKIVESIEEMNKTISDTISKFEYEIELISEYKISLINEAVTGKIKVTYAD